ncbi:Alcohol dehydrogenase GroES domain protein [Beutenbergia cavernae DSM 12333]|uniref:Alcohol dehydrogenase GroES domain protein n=1 Tax=Beutenbergia cavernae (strain ATCC BAA-8 / DSM 12333 / CCUG 43141 / JCM 11478 / NBRC 16432 / NCIMB 13614 / HKI 0122) TaxID=471853 RepID=C5BZC4_BEUC1|nr:L-threonine 3-dehydrogenase [Beutenbergia cavernae]ACQ79096.1 Alcohol dehydrogenase GroES domain protein [Beutenbergia cavernae DSM 12333]
MKALYKPAAGPGLELVERPEPEAGPDEVKIRVLRTGICGTDLHIESWDAWAASAVAAPLIPGHELYGEVVAVGDAVHEVRVGDRVSGEGHIVCGICRNCRAGRRQMCIRTKGLGVQRDGAFAEYVVLPESNVWVHHGGIDPDVGAIFDPFGNAVHTALRFGVVGEDVLVTGSGPIGLMAIAVARHVGARFVVATDVSPHRLDLALGMGADHVVDVRTERVHSAQEALGMREGFDVGFEMSGAPSALPEMIENMTHGASIAMLGLPAGQISVDWGAVVTRMITISGIYGRQMFETWFAMDAMLATSEVLRERVASVITDRFAAGDWELGFAAAASADRGKVILDWTEV